MEPARGARRVTSALFSVLGGAAFVLGVLAIITGSLTPLSLLVVDMVVMWTIATMRHAHRHSGAANRHMTRSDLPAGGRQAIAGERRRAARSRSAGR